MTTINKTGNSISISKLCKISKAKINLLYDITQILLDHNSQATTELEYTNPFTLLIAVLLSAQTTDKQVNIATRPIFVQYHTPLQILSLGEDLLKYTKTLNYYKTKTTNILKTCQSLVDMGFNNGEIPQNLEILTKLAGVGIKTAMVVLNVVYNKPFIPVDTHVHRILNRLNIVSTTSPNATSNIINQIPDKDNLKYQIHHLLILHARYVCKAIKPECAKCIIYDKCKYKNKII